MTSYNLQKLIKLIN